MFFEIIFLETLGYKSCYSSQQKRKKDCGNRESRRIWH